MSSSKTSGHSLYRHLIQSAWQSCEVGRANIFNSILQTRKLITSKWQSQHSTPSLQDFKFQGFLCIQRQTQGSHSRPSWVLSSVSAFMKKEQEGGFVHIASHSIFHPSPVKKEKEHEPQWKEILKQPLGTSGEAVWFISVPTGILCHIYKRQCRKWSSHCPGSC